MLFSSTLAVREIINLLSLRNGSRILPIKNLGKNKQVSRAEACIESECQTILTVQQQR